MLRPAGPAGRLTALVFLAACQPQARRLLLLDLALSDPIVLNGTAEPWRDAGYTVEYRRFYPHLTRADLTRYHTVVFLLGREPEAPSDALTAGDLALLDEWVPQGGVVVLGYDADGEGYLDRWTANRWLESRGAGISIGDRLLEDTTTQTATTARSHPWAVARQVGDEPLGSVYAPFPLDRNHVVGTRNQRQVLAATSRNAFVRTPQGIAERPEAGIAAAVRLGDGLVVVISRHALGALGPQYRASMMPILPADALTRTHAFLTALGQWTRRPAEWAHVRPAAHPTPLALQEAPLPVEARPPRLAPPDEARAIELPLVAEREFVRAANVPGWLRQQGMRVFWMSLLATRDGRQASRGSTTLDSLVTFVDAGGFNLLAGDAHPEWADSARARWDERDAVRRAWGDVVKALQPTSVAWIPLYDYGEARLPPADSSRGPRGEARPGPCALDSSVWAGGLGAAYSVLGRLAVEQRTLVTAVGLDLGPEPRPYGRGYPGSPDLCDRAWHEALTRLGRRGALDSLPYAERYLSLRETGLLRFYVRTLEDLVAERATAIRDRVLRQRRDLQFAFRLSQPPADWFSLGLLRGFALPDRPLLLLTPEVKTRDFLALLRARGVNAVHAVELAPAFLRTRDHAALRQIVFEENTGFWLPGEEARAGSMHTAGATSGTAGSAGGTGGAGGAGGAAGEGAARLRADSLARLLRRLVP